MLAVSGQALFKFRYCLVIIACTTQTVETDF